MRSLVWGFVMSPVSPVMRVTTRDLEGDGGHRPGGVVSHPGQGAEGGIVGGEFPLKFVHDLPGGLLQVAGPVVVAQTLPELHQLVLLHGGQIGHGGELGQEAGIIVHHRRHPGLLEHDLRQPHMVGRGVAAPGQHPGVVPEPLQQRDGQLRQFVHEYLLFWFVLVFYHSGAQLNIFFSLLEMKGPAPSV